LNYKIHKSCETLPIYSFYKLTETEDLRWLIVDYAEYEDAELKLEDIKSLSEVSSNIMNEYGGLIMNMAMLSNYKRQMQIEYLEYKYMVCTMILNLFAKGGEAEVLELLNEYDFKIDIEKDLLPQFKEAELKVKRLKMQIQIFRLDFDKKMKSINSDIKTNIEREALLLEVNLKLGYGIDTRKTSVSRWVTMMKLSNEKNKQNG